MKRRLKEVLSVVMAAAMLVTAVPTGMYAEEETPAATEQTEAPAPAEEPKEEVKKEEPKKEEPAPAPAETKPESAPTQTPAEKPAPAPAAAEEPATEPKAAQDSATAANGGTTAPAAETENSTQSEPAAEPATEKKASETEPVTEAKPAAAAAEAEKENAQEAAKKEAAKADSEKADKEKAAQTDDETAEEKADEHAEPETISAVAWKYGEEAISPNNGVYTIGDAVWDGTEKVKAVTASVQAGDTTVELTVTPAVEGAAYTAVEPGEYSFAYTAALPAGMEEQYVLGEGVNALTVNIAVARREIGDVTLTLANDTYTGATLSGPTMSVADGVLVNGDTADTVLSLSGNELKDAGEYTYTVGIQESQLAHYTFPGGAASIEKSVTVKPAVVEIEWHWDDENGAMSIVFDDEIHKPRAYFQGLDTPNTKTDCTGLIQNSDDEIREAKSYPCTISQAQFVDEYKNYTISADATATLTIAESAIEEITWDWEDAEESGDGWTCVYDTNEHVPTATFETSEGKEELPIKIKKDGVDITDTEVMGAGSYTAVIDEREFAEEYSNYAIGQGAAKSSVLTIKKYPIEAVEWAEWSNPTYTGSTIAPPTATFAGLPEDGTITVSLDDIWMTAFVPVHPAEGIAEVQFNADDEAAAVTKWFVNAGKYTVTAKITEKTNPNYELAEGASATKEGCEIAQQDISSVTWTVPSVYNGAEQAVTAVANLAADTAEGAAKTLTLKTYRLPGEGESTEPAESAAEMNAGMYQYEARIDTTTADYNNYKFGEAAEAQRKTEFTIAPRSITVHPDTLTKKFGEADVKPYTYDKTKVTDNVQDPVWGGEKDIRSELPDDLLIRKEGELPGTYEYSVAPQYLEGEEALSNYTIEVDKSVLYEIEKLKLTAEDKTVTSREGKFDYSTDMLEKKDAKADENVARKLVITATFPEDTQSINTSVNLDDFITNAAEGIAFTDEKGTVNVKDFTYSTTKGKKKLEWTGKLPAGTELTLAVYGRGVNENLKEEWTLVSNTAKVEVVKQPVAMTWGSTADEVPAANYLSKNDKLTLTASGTENNGFSYDSKNEYVEVKYNGTAYYPTLDLTDIQPVESNSGSKHNEQTATATFVDALNLEFSPVSYQFTYDNGAFDIPAENIQFHNRDKKISITLPETGTINSVTIPGGEVKVSGTQGDKFELDVDWSGRRLISSGSGIQVTYTDQGGNEGKGSATVQKSTVNTGLQMSIRPALNAQGYLNGESPTLIISGFGCVCEPINVSIAGGQTTSTNVAVRDVWNDEAGQWEIQVSMERRYGLLRLRLQSAPAYVCSTQKVKLRSAGICSMQVWMARCPQEKHPQKRPHPPSYSEETKTEIGRPN